jgi:membrane-bound lytic murein transglycosylase D
MEKKNRLRLFLLTMFFVLCGCQTITQHLPTILTAPFIAGNDQDDAVLDPTAFSFTEDFFLTADYLPEQWLSRIPPEDRVTEMLAQLNKEQEEGARKAFALVYNRQVNHYLALYQGKARGHLKTSLEKGAAYLPYITAVFKKENIPAELAYLALLESTFNVNAYSKKHAAGMWQFMRGTAQRCGLRVDRWVDERLDFEKSTRAAAFYLKQLYAAFGSWHLAVAAYNAGELPIKNAVCRNKSTEFWDITRRSSLKCETINFVPQLIAVAIIAANPAAYGFTDLRYQQPVRYDTVIIAETTDLRRAAAFSGCALSDIRQLNPAIRKNTTPPNYPDFALHIPQGARERFITAAAGSPAAVIEAASERTARLRNVAYTRVETDQLYTVYRVKSGDTLWRIARSYHIKPEQIKRWNKLNSTVLHPGTELRLILRLEKMI